MRIRQQMTSFIEQLFLEDGWMGDLYSRFNCWTNAVESTGWINMTCLIRSTGWIINWLNRRLHDQNIGPYWINRMNRRLSIRSDCRPNCWINRLKRCLHDPTVGQTVGSIGWRDVCTIPLSAKLLDQWVEEMFARSDCRPNSWINRLKRCLHDPTVGQTVGSIGWRDVCTIPLSAK